MFSRILTRRYTENYLGNIEKVKKAIDNADNIVIGAGSGLSTSAGLTYSGERFESIFQDFIDKYNIKDMYSGGFYPYKTLEEYWGWWSRHIFYNRYVDIPKDTYIKLLDVVKNKNYFVITTNVDHCFQRSGFDKERLFYMQGDYGLFQCSKPCHQRTYDNREIIEKMIKSQVGTEINSSLIPKCPICNSPMIPNLRCDDTFVEDEGFYVARDRYNDFLNKSKSLNTVYLELGVGGNTPVWIKYPFWKMTAENPKATYVCINFGESFTRDEIEKQSICINEDIDRVISSVINS